MTTAFVVEIARETVWTSMLVLAPILIVGFIMGVLVSFIQTILQLQDTTVAVIPKVVSISLTLVIFGHWMLSRLMNYTAHFLGNFISMTLN